ncbi:MAG: hypothetical protein ACJAYK_002749 [Crocinitomicaceae bacterium]|jgi:uncharacterized protein YheU (UPF0270 family)
MSESFEYTPIPFDQLSKDALQGVIEEYINREGTDYGHIEFSFEQKCEQVLSLIRSGKAQIVFDHQSQTVSIINRDQL